MRRFSGLLAWTATIAWRKGGRKSQRRPAARSLNLEDLEGRIVPTLLGQQLFPADYPWNQNISNAPVAANSAAIIAHIGSSIGIHPDWGQDSAVNGSSPLYGIPFNVVHGNSTAKVSVTIDDYPSESDIVPVPIPAGAVIEGDYQNGPNPNGPGYNANQRGDSHLLVWDEDNNIAYELYAAARPSDPVTLDGLPTGGKWHAAQESVWSLNTENFRSLGFTSADAAGLAILPGLARPDEGLPAALGGQGAINHALRFTLPSGDVNPQYLYPAAHVVNVSPGSTNLPLGARLRLMNTPAVNSVINTLGPQAQIVARAMQQYGLVLADLGSSMYVTGTSASQDANNNISLTWDMNDILGLKALNAGDFEVVNLTPVVTGLSAGNGSAGSSITINGRNFSGAAGHLTVLFGSTTATSVTVISDSQLSAVVPTGSGTVDVRVQSGINATDPNNPSDNVNNPIFGYGISAVSPADQFTFGNVPAPAAPSNLRINPSASLQGSTHLSLQWTDNSSNESGFLIERSADGTNFLQIASVAAQVSAYEDMGLSPGTKYYYRVRAYNAAGNSVYSNVASGQTLTVNEQLVHALYQDFLGREGSRPEWDGWVNQLPGQGAAGVVNALSRSGEALKRQVDLIYQRFLNRQADASGEVSWVQFLQQGHSEEQMLGLVLSGQEFFALQGNSNSGFVQGLYLLLLDRPASSGDVNGWLSQLPAMGRSGAAAVFLAAAEFRSNAVRTFYGDPSLPSLPSEPFFPNLLHRSAAPTGQEIQGWVNSPMDILALEVTMAGGAEYSLAAQKR